jgi:hypothetical protein
MKVYAPVLKTALITLLGGGDRPSPLPLAAIAWGLLLAGSLLTGCGSVYEVPQHVTEPAMIGGGVIYRADQEQLLAALFVTSVDEDPLSRPVKLNSESLFPVEPGDRHLQLHRMRVLTGGKINDLDYLPPLEVALLPGKTYRLTGKVIVGSAFAYWIEEVESGARITDVLYDPVQWTEGLREIAKQPPAPEAHATLDAHIDRHFTSKTYLLPGRDCFSVVYEIVVNGGAMVLSALAGSVEAVDYGYRIYNPICVDVEAGHRYQVKLAYFDRKDGRHIPKVQRDYYQVWDLTDDRVVLNISRWKLGRLLSGIE